MKKLFIILVVMLGIATTQIYAQNEVRGVETKLVKYYSIEKKTDYLGYEFYNMNSIPVSIDVELWMKKYDDDEYKVVETKTFVLDSKERYIWKHENLYDFSVNYEGWVGTAERKKPGQDRSKDTDYYVKYKAYKLE